MILKHSIKSIIRTPRKTILFLFLLIVLTVLLCIGAGMYGSARNMLREADKTFTSVVSLDYLGDPSGDEANFYNNMNSELAEFDFNKLKKNPDVKSVDMESSAWAFIEGNSIKRNSSPLYNYVMLEVFRLVKYDDNLYMGIVDKPLFGRRIDSNTYVMINDVDEQGKPLNHNFINGHKYLILGRFAESGKNAIPLVLPGLIEQADNIPSTMDLTDNPDFFNSEEGRTLLNF